MANPFYRPPGFAPFDDEVSMMIAATQRREDEIQARIRETREYFDAEPNYKFEDFAANGAYGVTCRVQQRGFGRRPPRRLIVKRALNDTVEGELQNEIRVMSELNGSVHIASVIASKDVDTQRSRRRCKLIRRVIERVTGKPSRNFLGGLAGPTLVLEYLGNGTLDKIRAEAQIQDVFIPNRILWGIFLCLVRACVAMKYAPGAPPDSKPKLEELPAPPPNGEPDGYHHGDMHPGNLMFGSAGDFPEHSIIPPVKLIDFGLTIEHEASAPRNLLDVSKNLLWLIVRGFAPIGPPYRIHRGIQTMGGLLLPNPISGEDPNPWLDHDLRDILLECMAVYERDRPSLEKALYIAKEAVEQRGAEFYGPEESDEAIRDFIQAYVYNA
ncbi:kinase-like domain-containing protein [Xylaria digitata]|nr:kinase-like domain-containing protein [Xylaria digitata]